MRKFSTFSHLLLIAILGLLIYSNTFNVPFHFDDVNYIANNPVIKNLSFFIEPSNAKTLVDKTDYTIFKTRYISFLTFALNYNIHGLNVIGYHIVNLIIHILNAILVYYLIVLTFKTPYFKMSVINVSNQPTQSDLSTFQPFSYLPLFIALIFVSHPIQTQAVTYIWQRVTSLATFFYLLSLVMYIKSRMHASGPNLHAKRYSLYAASFISAILAMMTKEIAFTLPILIALYEFMFFEGKIKRRILLLIPLLLAMFLIPLSRITVDSTGNVGITTKELTDMSRWDYLFTQFRVIVTYIRLLFLPINQNLDYDYPIYNSFLDSNVFLSFLFLLTIFALAIYLFHITRYTLYAARLIAFGIFWFFITLSVESSVIPIRDVIFEHRIYLPSVGAIIAFISTTFYISRAIGSHFRTHTSWSSYLLLPTVYCLLSTIIVLSIATYQRNIVWQDPIKLWEDVTKKSPYKSQPHNNLGVTYATQGKHNDAIREFSIALKLKPDNVETYNNIGNIYMSLGFVDKAIVYYQTALKLRPNFVDAHNNLGYAYCDKGWIDKAVEHYQVALKLNPDYAEAHNNLGVAYEKKGLLAEATKEYQIVLKLNSNDEVARNNLNRILQIKK